MDNATTDRRTGPAAIAAGLLIAASVGGELIRPVQQPDGTVTALPLFLLYGAAWLGGAVALLAAVRGLGNELRGPLPGSGRVGRRIAVAGASLLVAFGAAGLVGAVVTGAPPEWSFLLFALGMLLLLVAAVPLALGLRRAGAPAPAPAGILLTGAGILLALGVSADPWHDLGLFVFCGGWGTVGAGMLRGGPTTASTRPPLVTG